MLPGSERARHPGGRRGATVAMHRPELRRRRHDSSGRCRAGAPLTGGLPAEVAVALAAPTTAVRPAPSRCCPARPQHPSRCCWSASARATSRLAGRRRRRWPGPRRRRPPRSPSPCRPAPTPTRRRSPRAPGSAPTGSGSPAARADGRPSCAEVMLARPADEAALARRPGHRPGRPCAGPRPDQHAVRREDPAVVRRAGRAAAAGVRPGLTVLGTRAGAARRRGLRRHPRGRRRLGRGAPAGRAVLAPAPAPPGTSCWSARASRSTPAASRSSRATHEADAQGHGRRGRRRRRDARRRRRCACRYGSPRSPRSPRTWSAARRSGPGDVIRHYGGTHQREQQHRRRGPPGAGRRARLRGRPARART